jgi:uncharacterized protein
VIDWILIFIGGLLGSAHCVGMCGGFVLALGARGGGVYRNLGRQLVYSLGRVSVYGTAGAMAGFLGQRLIADLPALVRVQAILCLAAGLLLIYQGLLATGVLAGRWLGASKGPCIVPSLFGALLSATRLRSVFLAGAMNGLLPCGLVYAYLALAASAHDMLIGTAVMCLFGAGTMPVLAAVGCGSVFIGQALRMRVFQVAAWCVILTGILSVARGVNFLCELTLTGPESACPFCL